MSEIQYWAEVGQWQELEQAGKDEADWRKREDEELARQESEEADFCRSLEEQFPILKSWSTK